MLEIKYIEGVVINSDSRGCLSSFASSLLIGKWPVKNFIFETFGLNESVTRVSST